MQRFGYPIGWISQEKFHITLIFLGYLAEEKLDKVVTVLQETMFSFSSFIVTLGKISAFPSIKNPRVIFVSLIDGLGQTKNIYDDLSRSLSGTGFTLEKQEFTPHVTLGRVKDDDFYLKRKVGEMISRFKLPNFKMFRVSTISLFESIQVSREFVYKVLLSVPLGKPQTRFT
jgi:2'-5' RNA ligase